MGDGENISAANDGDETFHRTCGYLYLSTIMLARYKMKTRPVPGLKGVIIEQMTMSLQLCFTSKS